MTTLPQTSPIRLPRSGGTGAPGSAAAAAPHIGIPSATGPNPLTAADAWRVIRANLVLILTLLVLSAAAGYAVNYFLNKYYARYTATGYIEVQQNLSRNPLKQVTPQSDSAMDRIQRTQAQILRSEALLTKVLTNPDAATRKTAWFAQFGPGNMREAKKDLTDRFSVAVVPETQLIQVAMSYSDPRDCKTIVEDVVDQHLRDQAQAAQSRLFDKSQMLNAMKARYETEKRNAEQDLRDRTVKLSADGTTGTGRISIKELELSNLANEQIRLQGQLTQAKSMADAVTRQAADPAAAENPLVTDMVDRDPIMQNDRQMQAQLRMSLADVATRLGVDHPQYKTLLARSRSLDEQTHKDRADLALKLRTQLVERLRNQAAQAQLAVDDVDKRLDRVKGELAELTTNLAGYQATLDRIKTFDEMLAKVNAELDDVSTAATVDGGTVQWSIRPTTPDTPSFPRLAGTMSVSVALGLGLALGIAFLRELLDNRIRSPRDVARVGQLNLLGMVPDETDDPRAAGARLPLVIFDAPHSMTAERLREVRTRLQHAAALDTTRSLLVTSPSPGDGKTTVAANLAAGLALIGRRILLVDANFRRPDLHRVFNVDNALGFATVLADPDTFPSTVRDTPIPNLAILTTGPKPANTTEMLESQLLPDFIDRALQDYDHVIFDSGPLLYSSEAVAMAPKVDGVVTVVRAQANTRGVLQRLRDNLKQTKAENLGVVLNAVQAYGGGYYGRNIKTYYEYANGHGA